MAQQDTAEEPSARSPRDVVLLTHVLTFDDLLADAAVTISWPSGVRSLALGRAAEGVPTGLTGSSTFGLRDRFASSTHASIVREGASSFVLVDAGSRNGTFVNGARVDRHRLEDGDLIELGHSLLVFRHVPEPLAAALGDLAHPPLFGPTRTRSCEVALLVQQLERIAPTRQNVLLFGESGAGKEAAARMVHERSLRKGAFRAIDCGAIPEGLFESTLFGHRKGAFTGATEPRTGELKLAEGGTLFLDEVANASLANQAKLLRVLEQGRFTPLGAAQAVDADVRWVAATNAELFHADSDGAFRSDLLQRLAGYVGAVPALRRRREDLGALVAYLLREAGVRSAKITVQAARRLFNDAFAGNVRQLRNVVQSAAVLAGNGPIDLPHLGPTMSGPHLGPTMSGSITPKARPAVAGAPPAPPPRRMQVPDLARVEEVLRATRGNLVRSAELLDTHPRQLYRWLERLELSIEDFRK